MKRACILLLLFTNVFFASHLVAQNSKTIVYLIPGQGGDARLYNKFAIDSTYFEIRHITYFTPEKGWSMKRFAQELSKQIDTTQRFALVGVSLGGMLASEINEFLSPQKVILISSAKHRKELPFRYRFQKSIPIYKLVPKGLYKAGAKLLQPIVEPDRRHNKSTFVAMLGDKDPAFLKRTTAMIMEWDKTVSAQNNVVHIHGSNDSTIPARNVKFQFLVEGGSHMMVLTQAEVINNLVNGILLD